MAKAGKIIHLPESALVVLVGVAGSGKSTFANEKFRATEILSSDHFRAMVSDEEGDQEATDDAFALLHLVLEKRLRRGRVCLVDATNLRPDHRAKLMNVARLCKRPALAIVFDTPLEECLARAGGRLGRVVSAGVIHDQAGVLRAQTDEALLGEGFRKVYRLRPADRIEIKRAAAAAAKA
jgi:predicted kinase